MNGLRNFLLLGGIALSLALPQLAQAGEKDSSPAAKTAKTEKAATAEETPQINELDAGHKRGVNFDPISRSTIEGPAAMTSIKKNDVNAAIDHVSGQKRDLSLAPNHHVQPAVKKAPFMNAVPKVAKHGNSVHNSTASVTPKQSPKQVETASSSSAASALVKFQQNDGAVITASLDRSGDQPKYKVGDKMTINVKANQDCNVVVFNYDSTGTLTQIFPNDFQQNGFVKSGEAVQIGGADSPFDYQIAGKGGPEKIFVYAYPTGSEGSKPPITVAMAPVAGSPFRSTEMTVDQYRELVNSSKVFFSRSVQVVARKSASTMSSRAQLVSESQPAAASSSPNKIELTFSVDK